MTLSLAANESWVTSVTSPMAALGPFTISVALGDGPMLDPGMPLDSAVGTGLGVGMVVRLGDGLVVGELVGVGAVQALRTIARAAAADSRFIVRASCGRRA